VADRKQPITVAVVDDYEVVVSGVARMFDGYQDRVLIAELDASVPVEDDVDIALYDSFAQPEADQDEIQALLDNPHARRVVVYTWNFDEALIHMAMARGVSAYLSKTMPAAALVEALETVHAGGTVIGEAPTRTRFSVGLDWPGRSEGLSERESEILALITQGKSNAEVAELTYLSINSVKTHIRNTYRKIRVDSRTKAVLWGIEHDFEPDHHRIDHWRVAG